MQIKMDLQNGSLKCKYGQIDFSIDEDEVSIFEIFVSSIWRNKGIGSALVKRLEAFAINQCLARIIVPVTPSREALSFWLGLGYCYVFSEDMKIGKVVLSNQNPETIVDTDSGIILLHKTANAVKMML